MVWCAGMRRVAETMVAEGLIGADDEPAVMRSLLLRHRHVHDGRPRFSISGAIRKYSSYTSLQVMLPYYNNMIIWDSSDGHIFRGRWFFYNVVNIVFIKSFAIFEISSLYTKNATKIIDLQITKMDFVISSIVKDCIKSMTNVIWI